MPKTRTISIFSKEDRKLLLNTRYLIEELLETLDVLNSPKEMRSIAQAQQEIKQGKGRSFSERVEAIGAGREGQPGDPHEQRRGQNLH